MYYYLLDKLTCPITESNLRCEVFKAEKSQGSVGTVKKCKNFCGFSGKDPDKTSDAQCAQCQSIAIIDGKLLSQTGNNEYPIINGIPRMLINNQRQLIVDSYAGFLTTYEHNFKSFNKKASEIVTNNSEGIQKKTGERFGEQWNKFNAILPEYEKIFRDYFSLVDLSCFKDHEVLDAGCGMGRWAHFAAKEGALLYAFDLSKSVEDTYHNLKEFRNAHVVQSDIYNIPYKDESFDFVYSLGVIHYVTNPLQALKSIILKAKSHCGILIYVYYALDNQPAILKFILFLVTLFRKITKQMPKCVLYPLCYILSIFFKVFLVFPARIFDALNMKTISNNFPLNAYKDKPFKILYTDTIDRFSPPLEHRFTRDQITAMFNTLGVNDVNISDNKPHWCALGNKP